MNDHFSPPARKIDPYAGKVCPSTGREGRDAAEIGPTDLALAEWAADGLALPDLPTMRAWRHRRLVEHVVERGYAGVLMFDPLSIRYATDSTNMQVWNMHNPFRACMVLADGHMVLWEYKGPQLDFLSRHNPLVSEWRSGASLFYFGVGDKGEHAAEMFAREVADLCAKHAPGHKRIAADKILYHGAKALEAVGLEVMEGEELTEKARSIKGPDEIAAMRCAIHTCETACRIMEETAAPGMSEDEIWAVLHAENIKRGGEWIETRLLATGPRTNPWFQEAGARRLRHNEILAFDTDLVGPYGMCCDISRTWWIGPGDPTPEMGRLMRFAVDHIREHESMLKPGVSFTDLVFGGEPLPEEFVESRYSCKMHGVGLCDEWPSIRYPQDYYEGAFEYVLEPGMTLCVEALIAHKGGDFSIKLEDQVLITETGCENLTRYPFDQRLMSA
ncbi:MAG: dimethylsulfonioproprionate lyase DddP [Pseudomonadota bacterium]